MPTFELIHNKVDGRIALDYVNNVDEDKWERTGQTYVADDYYDAVAQVDTSDMWYKSTYGYYYL